MPIVLIFAEDPGSALFLQRLPAALRKAGAEVRIIAGPLAAPYFPEEHLLEWPPASPIATIREVGADSVVVGTSENPDSFALSLIDAARELGIISFGAVDSAPNAERRFAGRTNSAHTHAPDHLLVADETSAEAFRKLDYRDQAITICGHPRIDEISARRRAHQDANRPRQRAKLFPGAAAGQRVIVFVSETPVGMVREPTVRPADYTLCGTGLSASRNRIVQEELVQAARGLPEPPYLVLRLHPKQSPEAEAANAALFDQVSSTEPGLEVVAAADLVVGMTSILLVEAAALGMPVLSVVPRAIEREWLGDPGRFIPSVSTREALARWLGGVWSRAMLPDTRGGAIATMAKTILSLIEGDDL